MRAGVSALLCGAALLAGCTGDGQPLAGPASSGLVYVGVDGESTDLYRARLSDGAVRALVETPDRDESWPFWSQGAGRLVFQVRSRGSGDQALRLLDPLTGRVAAVPPEEARTQHWPVWAPDGARLGYVVVGGPPASSGIVVLDLASRRLERAAPSARDVRFFRPEFAPDGRRLVAQRSGAGSDSTLWILEPGVSPRPLTAGGGYDQKARFTRDGARVLFTRRAARGDPGTLMLIAAAGGDARPLAHAPGADDHSAWPSPVRDEAAFISDRNGSRDLFLVDLASGRARALTRTPELAERAPRWSPDGEHVAFSVVPVASEDMRPNPDTRVRVVDRDGRLELDVPGMMADWMPAW